MDVFATMASQYISKFSQLASPGAPLIMLNYYLQSDGLYVYR